MKNINVVLPVHKALTEKGGLGSAVSEVICDEQLSPKVFERIALPDVNVALIGHQEWIREQYGMNAEGIAKQIKETLKK